MPEESKDKASTPSPTPAKSFTWNQKAVDDKLEAVSSNLNKYVGKPGYNPYFYMQSKVKPLVTRVKSKEQTEELFNAIMALDSNIVPEAPGEHAQKNREEGCVDPVASGKEHAMGQVIKKGQD